MKTAFIIRHQHQGFVHQHVFSTRPTDEQIVAVLTELGRRHGGPFREYDAASHEAVVQGDQPAPEGSWYMIAEVAIYEPGELPEIPPDPNTRDGMAQNQISGVGTVTPPEGA